MGRRRESKRPSKRKPKSRGKPTHPPESRQPLIPLNRLSFVSRALLIVVILLICISLLYPDLAFNGKIFIGGDVKATTSFGKAAQKVMVREHQYPLWNPYLFSGMPSYESLAYNPYVYPLSFVTGFLIKKLHFPPATWLLFHTLLLGLGVFLLLKERGIPFIPSAMAAVCIIWMPNIVAIGANGHGSQAAAIAYMPFVLLLWDRISRGKDVILSSCLLAIVLGFQMLREHLQIAFYTYSIIGLHFLFFSALRFVDALRRIRPQDHLFHLGFLKKLAGNDMPTLRLVLYEKSALVAILAIVVLTSLLISSVLYVPVHEYSVHSIRSASESGGLDYDYATSWSLHPLETLTFVFPFSFGFGKNLYYGLMPFTDYPNYMGLIVIMGAIAAIFLARDRFVNFLIFLTIISTFVAFGKHFPILYDPLFKWFPFFNKFRVPVMVLAVQQLAMVVMFGIGFNAILKLDTGRGSRFALKGIAVFVIIFLAVLLSRNYWEAGFAESIARRIRMVSSAQDQIQLARMAGMKLFINLVEFSLLGAAILASLYLFFRNLIPKSVFIAIIVMVSILDFYFVDRYIIHPERFLKSDSLRLLHSPRVLEQYLESDPVIDFLKSDRDFYRIMPFYHPSNPFRGDFTSNRFMNFEISSVGGYHAAKLATYNNILKALGPALNNGHFQLLNMLNTRYIVATYPLPKVPMFELVWQGINWEGEKRFIYRNLDALPRVFFVDKYRIAHGDVALYLLRDTDINPSEVVLLEKPPSIEPVTKEGSNARITHFSFNKINIEAETSAPCIMVLSEIFYPRWKVYIDGNEGKILRANYILRAVSLPEGKHNILFRYDSSLIKKYFYVSISTFILTVILFSLALLRKRGIWKHSS